MEHRISSTDHSGLFYNRIVLDCELQTIENYTRICNRLRAELRELRLRHRRTNTLWNLRNRNLISARYQDALRTIEQSRRNVAELENLIADDMMLIQSSHIAMIQKTSLDTASIEQVISFL